MVQQQKQQNSTTPTTNDTYLKHHRLQNIANYESFHPTIMTCSDPIYIQQQQWNSTTTTANTATDSVVSSSSSSSSSLGAIAGPNGIIIFRYDQPHIPLLVLNYHHHHHHQYENNTNKRNSATITTTNNSTNPFDNNNSSSIRQSLTSSSSITGVVNTVSTTKSSNSTIGNGITSLAFSPIQQQQQHNNNNNNSTNHPVYLASSRGTGILLWDISSALVVSSSTSTTSATSSLSSSSSSLQPLQGRLGNLQNHHSMATTTNNNNNNTTTTKITTTNNTTGTTTTTTTSTTNNSSNTLNDHTASYNTNKHNNTNYNNNNNNNITSMTWMPNYYYAIVATTSSIAGLWDIRLPFVGTSSSQQRPCLRFADSTKHLQDFSPYCQIACNNNNSSNSNESTVGEYECAILNTAGVVRIYDIRMNQKNHPLYTTTTTQTSITTIPTILDPHPKHQFMACHYTGVGIRYLPIQQQQQYNSQNMMNDHSDTYRKSGWVTWGFDEPNTDAIVKIWMTNSTSTNDSNNKPDRSSITSTEQDTTNATTDNDQQDEQECRLVGQCTVPNLACARVCPLPIMNSIVTIGFRERNELSEQSMSDGYSSVRNNTMFNKKNILDWQADVWKLQFHDTALTKENTNSPIHGDDIELDNNYGFIADSTLDHVTTFHGPDENSTLSTILGKDKLMSLQAAEVTFTPYSAATTTTTDPDKDCELTLCCLTENGFVTTHAIPEVHSGKTPSGNDMSSLDGSATFPASIGQSTKLFPSNSETPISDAASAWGNVSSTTMSNIFSPIDRKAFIERTVALSKGIIISTQAENGSSQLDSNPVPLYPPTLGRESEATLKLITGHNADENQLDLSSHSRNVTEFMSKIETEHIPCPRLCGATFSSGVGGLTVFNNGNVKKMWDWYKKRHQSRLAYVPGLIGEPSLKDLLAQPSSSLYDADGLGDKSTEKIALSPRTLSDLLSMTSTAKEAQWGEQRGMEASSTDLPVFGDDFFDDDSNASSDSGEDNIDEAAEKLDNYTSRDKESSTLGTSKLAVSTSTGAASDMLTPFVKVSNEYRYVAFNHQNINLAHGWKLGDFDIISSQQNFVRNEKSKSTPFSPLRTFQHNIIQSTETSTGQALPSYRSLLPSTPTRKNESQQGDKYVEYESVHGGEYSVRPNMQESMVFLRKLFTQQHQPEGKSSFPNLMSPPDNPMLPKKTTSQRKLLPTQTQGTKQHKPTDTNESSGISNLRSLGVFTILANSNRDDEVLSKIEEICLYNAKVCEELGETVKMGTWTLVSRVVETKRKSTGRGFDGWGDALGVNMISSIIKFYESLGDVQMLSTLVCVLRNKYQDTKDGTKNINLSFLPNDQSARYDQYIRYYADLLYGWGLLTKRAEVVKHLTHTILSINTNDFGTTISRSGTTATSVAIDDGELAFDIECPRCGGYTHSGYCSNCHDYSFRCSLCDNAVRGLFTICIICGHGGHVTHLTEWFTLCNVCPTGCGCICKFIPSTTSSSITTTTGTEVEAAEQSL